MSRFTQAGPFWRFLLPRLGGTAITMPWRTVYYLPDELDETTRSHEQVHIEQIDRDGPIKFTLQYLWWTLRHGYRANPYEVEAYNRETKTWLETNRDEHSPPTIN